MAGETVLGDGSVRQLGDGLTLLFEEGVFPFAAGAASVAWSVAGSGAAPADAADFAGGVLPSGTLSFAPGQTSAILTVALAGDLTPEADEGFTVTLDEQGRELTVHAPRLEEAERIRRAKQRPPKPTRAAKTRGRKVREWDGEVAE